MGGQDGHDGTPTMIPDSDGTAKKNAAGWVRRGVDGLRITEQSAGTLQEGKPITASPGAKCESKPIVHGGQFLCPSVTRMEKMRQGN